MRPLQICLLAVVLTLTLHETLASTYEEDVDRSAEIEEKILVGQEDPEDSKTLESALTISNEDGNIQLKFWFQGDDDNEDEGSDFDSYNDNNGAITLDASDGGDDNDDYERSEGRYSPENGRRFYRRFRPFDEEEEEEEEEEEVERYGGNRCTRYGCFGGYPYGPFDDDGEYTNDPWRDYHRRRVLGSGSLRGRGRRRPFLGDDEDADND